MHDAGGEESKIILPVPDFDTWYSLARMAAEGRGMARDLDQAVRLMTVAASQDFDDAKALLAQYQQERDRDPASRP